MLPKAEELVEQVVAAVREEAKKIPWFNEQPNGAIMVGISPITKYASDWLLTSGAKEVDFLPDGELCATFCAPINPEGGYEVTFPDGDVVETKDYAFKKICHCWVALSNGFGYVSGLELPFPDLDEEHDFGPYRGAIAFQVILDWNWFCRVFVCVSGAKEMEDEQCAAAAIPVVSSFFENAEGRYLVQKPEIPEEKE